MKITTLRIHPDRGPSTRGIVCMYLRRARLLLDEYRAAAGRGAKNQQTMELANLNRIQKGICATTIHPRLHAWASDVDRPCLSVGLSYRIFTPLPHQDRQAKDI